MTEPRVGATVELGDGRKAIVRYSGDIHVSSGQFYGVELPDATGKNDGSVQGQRYFECPPGHGLFVRRSGIARVVAQPPQPATRRASVARPPVPKTQLRQSSVSASSRTAPKDTATSKRISVVTPAFQAGAKSQRKSSSASAGAASTVSSSATRSVSREQSSTKPDTQTINALETKLQHLERQYAEAKELLKSLDTVTGEKTRFESLVQKLQSKCQSFHQENVELKAEVKKSQTELDHLRKETQDHEGILEIITLDRELAEEKAEQAEAEAQALKERLEERELELDVLKGEAELLTADMPEEARRAAGVYRLQDENDRLKQAIIRMRDITEESESSLKQRIRELETDAAQTEQLRQEAARLEELVASQEDTITDLRQQVDAFEAFAEDIDEVTTENQSLREQLHQKDSVIRELEDLNQLNDELAVHQAEQAKDLREEVEAAQLEIAEQTQKIMEQSSEIDGQTELLDKFRDLVSYLQEKMTDAEASKTMSEEQAKDVTNRFNEVIELNRRLHTAHLNTTAKTIVSEVKHLVAQEASEQLEITRHFIEGGEDICKAEPMKAYFSAKRIGYKADLARSLLQSAGTLLGNKENFERFVCELSRCDVICRLNQLSIKSKRFWSGISTSTVEEFYGFANASSELAPVEKTAEQFLEALKKDEVNYNETPAALRRSDDILATLLSQYQAPLDARREDEFILRIHSIKANASLMKASYDAIGACVEDISITYPEFSEETNRRLLGMSVFRWSAQAGKAISEADKLVKALEGLRADGMAPNVDLDRFERNDSAMAKAASVVHRFAIEFCKLFVRTDDTPIFSDVFWVAMDALEEQSDVRAQDWEIEDVISFLSVSLQTNTMLQYCVEIVHPEAPWILKAREVQSAKIDRAEADARVEQVQAQHRRVVTQVREKDELIETKNLEIEHLRASLKAEAKKLVAKVQEMNRTEEELKQKIQQLEEGKAEIAARMEEMKNFDPHSHRILTPINESTKSAGPSKTEKKEPTPRRPYSRRDAKKAFMTFLTALKDENHWLRRREYAGAFENNMKYMFGRLLWAEGEPRREAERAHKEAIEALQAHFDADTHPRTSTPSYMSLPFTPKWLENGMDSIYKPDILSPPESPASSRSSSPFPEEDPTVLEDTTTLENTAVIHEISPYSWGLFDILKEDEGEEEGGEGEEGVDEEEMGLEGFSEVRLGSLGISIPV
ncbi:hypothetical protein M011DRAFT_485222 [Sporormia fimetaria CBS 119925]|uniref:CAP-Gly domain-containing protein n=1 Tax=Sporormia fimetaria CBS 119925 TaxID=1340428 RepID=A0A6A6VHA0_9PLEO|nr:hypothetical protein M011DRAFT_485222 [Sporormia fimetaria CBS 119925]